MGCDVEAYFVEPGFEVQGAYKNKQGGKGDELTNQQVTEIFGYDMADLTDA